MGRGSRDGHQATGAAAAGAAVAAAAAAALISWLLLQGAVHTRVGVGEGRASSAKSGGGWVPANDSSPDRRSLKITITSNKPGGVDKI